MVCRKYGVILTISLEFSLRVAKPFSFGIIKYYCLKVSVIITVFYSLSNKNLKPRRSDEGPAQRMGVPVPSQPEPTTLDNFSQRRDSNQGRWAMPAKMTSGTLSSYIVHYIVEYSGRFSIAWFNCVRMGVYRLSLEQEISNQKKTHEKSSILHADQST